MKNNLPTSFFGGLELFGHLLCRGQMNGSNAQWGRDQVSEWQLKQKNHCTFLEDIKTQVQLNST